MGESLNIRAMTPEALARLLSAAYRRNITVEQITEIVTEGEILSDSGTVDVLEFAAYLLKGEKNET